MKYNILHVFSTALTAVALISAAASCTKHDNPYIPENETSSQVITLDATMELPQAAATKTTADAVTKTSLQSDRSVFWSEGDKISVFFGDDATNNEFTLVGAGNSASGSFTGTAPDPVPADVYAVYPYKAGTSMDMSTKIITLNLPAVQTYTAGTFDDGMNPAVAYKTAAGNLTFKNLCGVLKLHLKVAS